MFENQRLIGEDVKAWLAQGFGEIGQIGNPGVQQIQPVSVPGQMFMPTQGEATAERLNDQEMSSAKTEPDMDND